VLTIILSFILFTFPQQAPSVEPSQLTGVYRIDIGASDKLYSVVAGASSKVPFREQQRFFIDLAVRFTPPDLLAIEQRGKQISLGSSRAPRMTFVADGVARNTRAAGGHPVRVRFAVENDRLVFTSSGKTEDNFSIVFESIDDGRRLRVMRRIEAEGLDQPLVIRSIYNKVSDVAQWELYGEPQIASTAATVPRPARPVAPAVTDSLSADELRNALVEWIDATNNRDIEKQMSFYVPRLRAYYLTRNTSRDFVRDEKQRVFGTATVIDVRAEEPEIIFQDGGRAAIMRYRKKYRIENGRRSRRGEVIQELRWQRTGREWRIFSERDIRVL
jgi:ketosteroid isomerase-like protein